MPVKEIDVFHHKFLVANYLSPSDILDKLKAWPLFVQTLDTQLSISVTEHLLIHVTVGHSGIMVLLSSTFLL